MSEPNKAIHGFLFDFTAMQASTSTALEPPAQPPRGVAYRLQTHTFIEAGEEVDIEEDVLEDLLSGFDEDDLLEGKEPLEVSEKNDSDDVDLSEFEEFSEEAGREECDHESGEL